MISIAISLIIISLGLMGLNYYLTNRMPTKVCLNEITNLDQSHKIELKKDFKNLYDLFSALGFKMQNQKQYERVLINYNDGYFTLEDKNFKSFCFKNRRRFRKTLLKHEDIIDIGTRAFIVSDPNREEAPIKRRLKRSNLSKHNLETITNYPILQPLDAKQKPFYIDKNQVYIGRSKSNDLVIRSPNVSVRQAMIQLENGKARIFSLTNEESIYVNGKRIDMCNLQNKDEVAFNNHKYKFIIQS